MTIPATSRISGKVLSANTLIGYAADWALFTDWCAATNRVALPADWATVTAFTSGCPGAAAIIRRRFAAIAYHHRAADQPSPTDPDLKAAPPLRELIDARPRMIRPRRGCTGRVPAAGSGSGSART